MEANYFTILWWFLPYIDVNQPRVYMCSPSCTPLPPPSLSHPSGSSQCTIPEHLVSCIEPGLAICFTYDNMHVSLLLSQIILASPSPTESKSLFFTSVERGSFNPKGFIAYFCGDLKFPESSRTSVCGFWVLFWGDAQTPAHVWYPPVEEFSKPPHPPHPHPKPFSVYLWLLSSTWPVSKLLHTEHGAHRVNGGEAGPMCPDSSSCAHGPETYHDFVCKDGHWQFLLTLHAFAFLPSRDGHCFSIPWVWAAWLDLTNR